MIPLDSGQRDLEEGSYLGAGSPLIERMQHSLAEAGYKDLKSGVHYLVQPLRKPL